MKFYVTTTRMAEVAGCHLTLREAKAEAEKSLREEGYCIDAVEVDVTAETVRRLLGNLGGYARSTRVVCEREPQS
jgi:hypothetical protein